MSAYATASRAYTESSVLTAPPERLVVMLYDGAGQEAAGAVAERLESIYLFCERTLVEAQLRRDPAKVDRVAAMLAELREAWAAIAENPPS